MKKAVKAAGLGAAVLVAAGMMAGPADAKIRCKGPYQIIPGVGEHASPYCEDNYLAGIARSRGFKVSNRAVRNNPSVKADACYYVGYDIRVQHICENYRRKRPYEW